MDMKALLEKMTQFAGQAVGQKPGDQVRGTDKAKKGGKEHPFQGRLVGDSKENMLKGLSKLAEEKAEEWAIAEAYQQFLEAQIDEDNLGVEEKRPARKGSRPGRDYGKDGQPSKRYNTVKEHGDPWERDQEGNALGWKAEEDEENIKAIQANAKKYPNGDPRVKPLKAKDATKIAHDVLGKSFGSEETDESRGHKIVATKLKDIERSSKPTADVDLTSREEQAKADYRKYVEKMKKLNPNYVPMYKMDEAGANNPQQVAQPQQQAQQQAQNPAMKQQAVKVAAATSSMKSATNSPAPATNIAKAIDHASQGKAVGQQDMKVLAPMIGVLGQAAQNPQLANQFKTLATQAKQVSIKQAQQAKQDQAKQTAQAQQPKV